MRENYTNSSITSDITGLEVLIDDSSEGYNLR